MSAESPGSIPACINPMSARINCRSGLSPTRLVTGMIVLLICPASVFAIDSTCYGDSRKGRIDNAWSLPGAGTNFVSYGNVPELAGRTYVHSKVYQIVVEAYRLLEQQAAGKVFKYAETGLHKGGPFPPHKTHQNGTSVDFIVPVLDRDHHSVQLPTNLTNRYGYDIEFDQHGNFAQYRIDFDAVGAHLMVLQQVAGREHVKIKRVIFDPPYHAKLYNSQHGAYIQQHLNLQKKHAWVRHDEHYHVDFDIKCKPL